MRLTASQHEHLQELSIALARPTADSDALVKRGLAEQGKGKFGEWVRITAKGKAEMDSRMTRDRGARAASTVSSVPQKRTTVMPAAVEAKVPPPLGACTRTATTRASAAAGSHTPSASTKHALPPECDASEAEGVPNATPVQGRRRRTPSYALGDGAAGVASPSRRPSRSEVSSSGHAAMVDAIRVRHGIKVTYYPISMSTSIQNGEHCKTGNPFYRSLPVAASAQDREVL